MIRNSERERVRLNREFVNSLNTTTKDATNSQALMVDLDAAVPARQKQTAPLGTQHSNALAQVDSLGLAPLLQANETAESNVAESSPAKSRTTSPQVSRNSKKPVSQNGQSICLPPPRACLIAEQTSLFLPKVEGRSGFDGGVASFQMGTPQVGVSSFHVFSCPLNGCSKKGKIKL